MINGSAPTHRIQINIFSTLQPRATPAGHCVLKQMDARKFSIDNIVFGRNVIAENERDQPELCGHSLGLGSLVQCT